VLKALTSKLSSAEREIERGAVAAEFAVRDQSSAIHIPSTPLRGYEMLELRVFADSPARGQRVQDIDWPPDSTVMAVTQGREIHAASPELELHPGERVIVLAPTLGNTEHQPSWPASSSTSKATTGDGSGG
jgi:hypothetical protein